MVTVLMMSAKMATLGHLKIKILFKKGYDAIISACDVTSKFCESNYIVNYKLS